MPINGKKIGKNRDRNKEINRYINQRQILINISKELLKEIVK